MKYNWRKYNGMLWQIAGFVLAAWAIIAAYFFMAKGWKKYGEARAERKQKEAELNAIREAKNVRRLYQSDDDYAARVKRLFTRDG